MMGMIWKISVRNLFKHKIFSLINVFGLALGFTAFILISMFIRTEGRRDEGKKRLRDEETEGRRD